MERAAESIACATEELQQGKKELEKTVNQMLLLSDSVQSAVAKQITEVRAARMTLTTETEKLLQALRDVRAFFLDRAHEDEVKKLAEFVHLTERLVALKQTGALDTIIDSIIRLEDGK